MTANSGRRIIVLGQLPPPVHGSNVVTEMLVDALSPMHVVTLVPKGFSKSVREVGRFRLIKLLRGVSYLTRAWLSGIRVRPAIVLSRASEVRQRSPTSWRGAIGAPGSVGLYDARRRVIS